MRALWSCDVQVPSPVLQATLCCAGGGGGGNIEGKNVI